MAIGLRRKTLLLAGYIVFIYGCTQVILVTKNQNYRKKEMDESIDILVKSNRLSGFIHKSKTFLAVENPLNNLESTQVYRTRTSENILNTSNSFNKPDVIVNDISLINHHSKTNGYWEIKNRSKPLHYRHSQNAVENSLRQKVKNKSLPVSKELSKQKHFQEIDKTKNFVYSAYYDSIDGEVIKVISLYQPYLRTHLLSCLLWNEERIYAKTLTKIVLIPESNYGYRYRSAVILCYIRDKQRPTYVSITEDVRSNFSNKVKVVYPGENGRKYNLTKCIPPLHSKFKDKHLLIENIESTIAIEQTHFIFYLYDIHPGVKDVLRKYQQEGVVSLYQWPLPAEVNSIHYYGQLASMHDCLYNNMYVSKWVMFLDLDELVVPIVTHATNYPLSDVINRLIRDRDRASLTSRCGSFMFLNAFIPLYLPDTSFEFERKRVAKSWEMKFLLKTMQAQLLSPTQRSKILVNPLGVNLLSIHKVTEFRVNFSRCLPSPRRVLLHHYRATYPTDLSLRGPYEENTNLQVFSERIIDRYIKACKKYL